VGTISVKVQTDRIRLDEILLAPVNPRHGAQILFTGRVRNLNLGKAVRAVSYDAFEPLAEKILSSICTDVQKKAGELLDIVVIHRIGHLEIGEVSVAVYVGAPHRDEAYRASREILEQLKARAPIWKKEHYEDGDSEWLQGHALCGHTPSLEGDHSHGSV
jgi:molybdopterin synthase catalytic subunit